MCASKSQKLALMLILLSVAAIGSVSAHRLTADPTRAANRKGESEPISVKVVKPKAGGLELTIKKPATIHPYWSAPLVPRVAGVVEKVDADVGDRFKKGQLLVKIDAPNLVRETKKARIACDMAKARLEEAEARLALAKTELQAAKDLLTVREEESKKGGVSAAELLRARSDVPIQTSKVRYGQAALRSAQANLEMAEVGLETARYRESCTRIVAPFDGVVKKRYANIGLFVGGSESREKKPLVVVEVIDRLRIIVRLPERYLFLVQPGDPVDFEPSFLPGIHFKDLKIAHVMPSLVDDDDAAVVEIEVANPKAPNHPNVRLLSGMSGFARIRMKTKPNPKAFVVPSRCLVTIQEEKCLYVVRDGKAHRKPVGVSFLDEKNAEIAEGIDASDLIITNNQYELEEGTPVNVEKAP